MTAICKPTAFVSILVAILIAFAGILVPQQSYAASSTLQAGSAKAFTVKKAKISSLKSTSAGKATIKVKKVSGARGYQFVVATNKAFTKNVKKKSTSKLTHTFSGLSKGKKYYAKARAYIVKSGKKQWGAWSTVKTVTVKKAKITTKNSPMKGTWALSSMKDTDGKSVSAEDIKLLKSVGMYCTLTLSKNGKAKLDIFGDVMSGTWKAKSKSKGAITIDGDSVNMTLKGKTLTMANNGASLVFRKK